MAVNQMEVRNNQQMEGRYLLFSIGQETYGVGIHRVREIIGPVELQALPEASPTIAGVVTLRGKTIPVVDLKSRLGLEPQERTGGSCVLTVLAKGWEGPLWMGILVDGVQEVVQVRSSDLEELPEMEEDPRSEWLMGLAKTQDRIVLLLDVDRVAKEEEVESVKYSLGGSHEAL